jgi:2-polyprenyl-3-methyl-5-hydroxy-6-metoxy-1,4-benzoquinol methylase
VELDRVPEPELMIDPDQAAAYSAADFAEAHQRLVDRFVDEFGELVDRDLAVLDLGCGPADVTTRLAAALPRARITGVDGSEAMLELGRARLAAAGLDDRVRLECRLLPDPTLPSRAFDLVVSTSVLHHLDDPSSLWTTVARCAAPGAAAFVADLRRPPDARTLDLLVGATAGEPEVLVTDFRNSLLASYRVDEVREQVAAAGLDLDVEELGERHLVAWGRTPH